MDQGNPSSLDVKDINADFEESMDTGKRLQTLTEKGQESYDTTVINYSSKLEHTRGQV